MAAIDKIYGTGAQWQEFMRWILENRKDLACYFYPQPPDDDANHPLTNFPEWADKYLLMACPIPWVVKYIREQYNLDNDS